MRRVPHHATRPRAALHRTAHLAAALLLLAASVVAVLPAAAGPAAGPACDADCPMMAAAARGAEMQGMSCHRPGDGGFACCDGSQSRPAPPADATAQNPGPSLDAPVVVAAQAAPPSPARPLRGADAAPPLPPGPDLFLLHSSLLN